MTGDEKKSGNDLSSIRGEIRDLSARKGFDVGGVHSEIVRMLPEGFVLQYELLWLRGLKGVSGQRLGDPDSAVEPAKRTVRVSTTQVETRGAARSGGRRQGVSGRTLLADLRAVAFRSKIDRKLRALAREMARWSGGDDEKSLVRRCTKCRVWTEDGWNFCPRDGAPTEDVL